MAGRAHRQPGQFSTGCKHLSAVDRLRNGYRVCNPDPGAAAVSAGYQVQMLADGNGDYVAALGLELDASGFGMGQRGQRFSIIVDDGVVTNLNVEAAGEFKASTAETALEQLG